MSIQATSFCCCLVAQSCLTLCNPMCCTTLGMNRMFPISLFPISPKVCPSSCPFHQCHPAIASSDTLSSFCSHLSLHQELFQWASWVSREFASDNQNTGISASASVLPTSFQGWFPLSLAGWISLLSKGLSGVCSGTTGQRHQLFGTPPPYAPSVATVHDHWENHREHIYT